MPLPVSDDPITDQGRLYVSPSLPVGDGGLPVQQPIASEVPTTDYTNANGNGNGVAARVINRLLGTGGEQRYQTWPEKLLRNALSAPHDVMTGKIPIYSADPITGEVNISPQLIKSALDVSALAGTGGLAGVGEGAGAALGSSPFLRPALRYEGRIYKAPMGGQHMDAIPKDLQPEFTRQAMSGEDISNFNFGFMNHKGQFLDREKALKYAIDEGLMSPHDAKYGALTSTMDLAKQPSSSIKDYIPAVRDPETGKIYSNENGHISAMANLKSDVFKRIYNDKNGQGFIDNQGNYISRQDFKQKYDIESSVDLKNESK